MSLCGQFGSSPTVRAVVIGISDYQDDGITDLQFAHRDAEAFSKYLLEVYPGKVLQENVTVFTNEEATGGRVHNAFNKLLQESIATDRIFIYFSGHGDVETVNDEELGHLLLYDTPSNIYQLNSLRITDLREVVRQLSIDIGADVVLITDACRSGRLAGEGVKGVQLTNRSLTSPFGNETKILSCQIDEYSLEGQRWGGGRGVFSYHLIEGLTGMADQNNDFKVTLRELQRYLEDRVESDVSPKSQSPVTLGNKNSVLTLVNEDYLVELIRQKTTEAAPHRDDNTRIFTKSIQSESSELDIWQDQFYQSLQRGHLVPSEKETGEVEESSLSALSVFEKIESLDISAYQLRSMRGDLVASLQDGAQAAINAYLKSEMQEMEERELYQGKKYEKFPGYLRQASRLLGPNHYLYNQLLARQHYFEAVIKRLNSIPQSPNYDFLDEALEHIQTALIYEERAAYIFNELGLIYNRQDNPNAMEMYEIAAEFSPGWATPYANMAYFFFKDKQYDQAEKVSIKAINLNHQYLNPHWILSEIYLSRNEPARAERVLLEFIENYGIQYSICNKLADYYLSLGDKEKAIEYYNLSNEDVPNFYANVGLGMEYYGIDNEKTKSYWLKAQELFPYSDHNLTNIGWMYHLDKDYDQALQYYSDAIRINPKFTAAQASMGKIYFEQGKMEKAIGKFKYVIDQIDAAHVDAHYFLSRIYSFQNDTKQSLFHLNKAVSLGYPDIENLKLDNYLENVRNTKEFDKILASRKGK